MPKPTDPERAPRVKKPAKAEAAFDVWLNRGLHEIYDNVAKEPIPEDLLRLIEDDRNK